MLSAQTLHYGQMAMGSTTIAVHSRRLAVEVTIGCTGRQPGRAADSFVWRLQEDPGAIDEDRNGQLPQDRCPVTKADAERLKAAKVP
jgi:hypothetical protein